MLEPEVVASTIGGIQGPGDRTLQVRGAAVLAAGGRHGATARRADGRDRICIDRWRRLKPEGPRVEGGCRGQIGNIETDPTQPQRRPATYHHPTGGGTVA
jgi:hypothetical protein